MWRCPLRKADGFAQFLQRTIIVQKAGIGITHTHRRIMVISQPGYMCTESLGNEVHTGNISQRMKVLSGLHVWPYSGAKTPQPRVNKLVESEAKWQNHAQACPDSRHVLCAFYLIALHSEQRLSVCHFSSAQIPACRHAERPH